MIDLIYNARTKWVGTRTKSWQSYSSARQSYPAERNTLLFTRPYAFIVSIFFYICILLNFNMNNFFLNFSRNNPYIKLYHQAININEKSKNAGNLLKENILLKKNFILKEFPIITVISV